MIFINEGFQKTINKSVKYCGISLHSGLNVNLELCPGGENSGVIFVRDDVICDTPGKNLIYVNYKSLCESTLCTKLRNSFGVEVSTTEHLLAAIYAFEIDNIEIHLNQAEVPIFDGSSKEIVDLLIKAGEQHQKISRKIVKITKNITVQDDGKFATMMPNDYGLSLEIECDFISKNLYGGSCICSLKKDLFIKSIAPARTFGFVDEFDTLRKYGLAIGASLNNVIAIDNAGTALNKDGLRFEDEILRHKALDTIGDVSICGYQIHGTLKSYCSGHKLNAKLVTAIMESCGNNISET